MKTSRPNYHLANTYRQLGTIRHRDVVLTGVKSGVIQQDWRRKIKLGLSASSPYTVDFAKTVKIDKPLAASHQFCLLIENPIGFFNREAFTTVDISGYQYDLANFGDLSQIAAHLSSISSEVDNAAISKLHSKIREDGGSAQGLVFLGELRETIGLLRNPFGKAREKVTDYLRSLKSTRAVIDHTTKRRKSETAKDLSVRRAQNLVDAMSSAWLETQYALLPLISDTQDIIGAAEKLIEGRERRKRYVSRKFGPTVSSADSFGNQWMYTCMENRVTVRRTSSSEIQYIAIYKHSYDGSVGLFDRAQRLLGFNLQDFVPAIWELVPWSFLIDYFANIGKILEAGTTCTDGLVTCVKTILQRTLHETDEALAPYNEGTFNFAWNTVSLVGRTRTSRSFLRTTVTRTVADSLPIPSLEFSVPGFGTKWANMVALLLQQRSLTPAFRQLSKNHHEVTQ